MLGERDLARALGPSSSRLNARKAPRAQSSFACAEVQDGLSECIDGRLALLEQGHMRSEAHHGRDEAFLCLLFGTSQFRVSDIHSSRFRSATCGFALATLSQIAV